MTGPSRAILASVIGAEAYDPMLADPARFVEAFDRPMWGFQKDVLREVLQRDDDGIFIKPTAVFSAPRQNSKSTLITWAGLWRLFVDPTLTGDVLVVALDREGARVVFGDAVQIVKNSDILMGLIDGDWGLTRNEIRLKNGRRMLIRPADAVRSRGLRVGCLLYDEAGWSTSDDLFETLSAAMGAQRNPLTLIASTVGPVQAGVLWRLFESAERGDPAVRLIYHQENLSPLISDTYLERQREILPSFVYAREHENTWGTASDVFATHDDWKRAMSDGDPRRASDVGPSYLFCDLGWTHDLTAIAIAKETKDGKVDILALETFKGSQSDPVQLEAVQFRIEDLGRLYGLKRVEIESPQGLLLSQKLNIPFCKVTTLHPTLRSNQARWGGFYKALKEGSVRLPPDANLRRELLTLTIEERAIGWRVQDVPSIHNDRAVAVAGALFLASGIGRSRWAETKFLAITSRGILGPGGKLLEQDRTRRPAWISPTGSELRRQEEERQLARLSTGRKVRIRQMIALGRSVVQLQRQFSLSRWQVERILDRRATH